MNERSTIHERLFRLSRGLLSADLAKHILTFDFPPEDHARYSELSAKASEGSLTPQERTELEDFLDVNDFLSILRADAEALLDQHSPAA